MFVIVVTTAFNAFRSSMLLLVCFVMAGPHTGPFGNRVSSLTLWFERRSTTPGQRAARSHVVCGDSNEVSLVLQGMLAVCPLKLSTLL